MMIKKVNVTFLTKYKVIPIFFSLRPFLDLNTSKYVFKLTSSIKSCLRGRDKDILIILRLNESVIKKHIAEFKQIYNKVIIYDEHDSSALRYLSLMDEIDFYINKLTLKDLNEYKKYDPKMKLNRLYFQNKLIHNSNSNVAINEKKLISSWDLSLGLYPVFFGLSRISYILMVLGLKKTGYKLGKSISQLAFNYFFKNNKIKIYDVFAVFSQHKKEDINYQRKWLLDKYQNDSRFFMQKTNQWKYYKTISKSRITISPFGWGEICFRDYEAIFAKSLLFKPNMDIFEVSKSIFIPFETYIPFKWDMSDFGELLEYYLNNDSEIKRITKNAYRVLMEFRDKSDEHALKILNRITEGD